MLVLAHVPVAQVPAWLAGIVPLMKKVCAMPVPVLFNVLEPPLLVVSSNSM